MRAGYNATTTTYSVAIGRYAFGAGVLTGTSNIAVGMESGYDLTSGTYNFFGGYRAGYNATTASNTVAIGKNAIALGVLTGDDNIAIGQLAGYDLTSGASNVLMGYQAGTNVTTGADNTILGPAAGDALTTGSNNTIIGHDAAASAVDVSNEITMGDTNVTKFRVPGLNFIIKDSTATDNYVLTVDSNGEAGWEAAGGGGADLYAANESSPAAQPSATGANAIAIGDQAVASAEDSLAIGTDTDATAYVTTAIGKGAQATAQFSLALGLNATASAERAVAIGNNGVIAGSTYSTAIGHNSGGGGSVTATGSGATALGGSYASGASSLAAAISNNTSSYGATGGQSVAIGQYSRATVGSAIAIGSAFARADGGQSVAIGRNVYAQKNNSVALGYQALSDVYGKLAYSGGNFAATGDSQLGICVLRQQTADATATVMVTVAYGSSASTLNQVILPNNSAYAFHGTIVARQQASQGTACAAWKIEGLIRREANAGTTVLVDSTTTVIDNTPSWGMALTADTTNGGLKITVTGASSTNIRWVATVNTSEVTY
jgi:hypothetical protein